MSELVQVREQGQEAENGTGTTNPDGQEPDYGSLGGRLMMPIQHRMSEGKKLSDC